MKYKIFIFIVLALFLISFLSAEIKFSKQDAELCLNNSEKIILNFQMNNYSYSRLNDSFKQAKAIFNSQLSLSKGQDFSYVQRYCEDIKNISKLGLDSRISFFALKNFYNLSLTSDMNTSKIDSLMNQINTEINNERYELVSDLINNGYVLIIDTQSQNSAVNIFYDSTKTGFQNFLDNNWKFILGFISLLLFLFLFYRMAITRYVLRNKLINLEKRKESIKDLLRKTQKEYFQENSISEVTYNVRVNTYGDMVRDIDRQIPLLKESLIKVSKIKSSDK